MSVLITGPVTAIPPPGIRLSVTTVLDPTQGRNIGIGGGVFAQKVGGNVLEFRSLDGYTLQGDMLVPAPTVAAAQVNFWIDPATGNDSNTGASSSEALATWAEYDRRVRDGLVTASPFQTVNVLGDLPASDPIVVNARYEGGLVIQGQRTAVYSGTVTSAVAWDDTTSPVTPGTLEDASLPGTWSDSGPGSSSLIGRMIVMTSGANVGKTGWLLADLGAKTARLSQLFDVFSFTVGTPAPGETFDVVDLTVAAGGVQHVGASGAFVALDSFDVTASQPLQATGGSVVPSNSRFIQTGGFTLALSNCVFQPAGCLFTNSVDITAAASCVYFANSFVDARVRLNHTQALFVFVNPLQKAGGTFASSTAFTCADGGGIAVSGSVGVLDQATGTPDAFLLEPGGEMSVSAGGVAFTVGQTVGVGIEIQSYGFARWATSEDASVYDFDISGGASEWVIGGATTTSAALGAAGAITAANNAGAVPST